MRWSPASTSTISRRHGREPQLGMDINRQTLRRAGGLAAAALLALTLGAVAPTSQGSALGGVIAITPNEVIPNGFVGFVEDPSLSGRGESAGVYDAEVQRQAFVFLDATGQEPMLTGLGITVSGDRCMALWARNNGSTNPADSVSIGVTNRCDGSERELLRTNSSYQSGGGLALNFDGRFGVAVLPPSFGSEFEPNAVVRIDTSTGGLAFMPPHGFPYFGWDPTLGVDISDDGNVVVAVESGSLATATAQLLRDVVAWDVASNTTAFLSGPPSQARGSGFPSVSGDGRFVSFTSIKPLTGPQRAGGPWTFITDRSNGQIRMISVPTERTYHSSITRDASQVAYTVAGTACQFNPQTLSGIEFTCQGARVNVAFGPTPGFTAPFSRETISILANGGQGGMHMMPALSGNGQWVAWISNAGQALLGSADPALNGQHAFTRRRDPGAAIDALNFGTIAASTSSAPLTATLTNTGRTSLSVDSITVTPGQFQPVGGGTCVGGMLLPPGATCTVNVRFNAPNNNSTVNGTIQFTEFGKDAVTAQNTLTGASSFTPPPTTSTTTTTTTVAGQRPPPTTTTTTTTTPLSIDLNADPNPVDFGQVAVGIGSPIQTVTITNVGTGSGQLLTELTGPNPDDFFVARNGCNEVTLAPTESCTMDIMMIPLAGGRREAAVTVTAGGASGDVGLLGTGHFAPQLLASPAAITTDGFTTIIGRGFPPNQTFDVHVDPTGLVIAATSDAQGQFRIPIAAVGKLGLGNYILRVDPVPDVFDLVRGQLVVVLATFEPQGPGGAAFGDALIVTRGS